MYNTSRNKKALKSPCNDSAIFLTKQKKVENGGKNRKRLKTITTKQVWRDKKLGVLSGEKRKEILRFSFARTGIFVTNRVAIFHFYSEYGQQFKLNIYPHKHW